VTAFTKPTNIGGVSFTSDLEGHSIDVIANLARDVEGNIKVYMYDYASMLGTKWTRLRRMSLDDAFSHSKLREHPSLRKLLTPHAKQWYRYLDAISYGFPLNYYIADVMCKSLSGIAAIEPRCVDVDNPAMYKFDILLAPKTPYPVLIEVKRRVKKLTKLSFYDYLIPYIEKIVGFIAQQHNKNTNEFHFVLLVLSLEEVKERVLKIVQERERRINTMISWFRGIASVKLRVFGITGRKLKENLMELTRSLG